LGADLQLCALCALCGFLMVFGVCSLCMDFGKRRLRGCVCVNSGSGICPLWLFDGFWRVFLVYGFWEAPPAWLCLREFRKWDMQAGGVSGTRRRFDCRDGSGCSCGRCGGCGQCALPRRNSDDGVNRTRCLRLSCSRPGSVA
jgi:hypothetical protein